MKPALAGWRFVDQSGEFGLDEAGQWRRRAGHFRPPLALSRCPRAACGRDLQQLVGQGPIKYDGYRSAARLEGSRICMLTRSGLDGTAKFRLIAPALAALLVRAANLDDEIAVVGPDGVSSFAEL